MREAQGHPFRQCASGARADGAYGLVRKALAAFCQRWQGEVKALARWRRYEPGRQALMRAQLERLAATPKLSKDLYEVVSKALA
ncbi:MAG: aminopeptidase N C-terminal domain-containing protein [Immundisolibacter sp.]|uniref:aminopeptidase N C-terminal domain-containing protein n=1 Tax=Immundisolibacter sp. TaxID=1934948 RepID=UPI003EE0D9DE